MSAITKWCALVGGIIPVVLMIAKKAELVLYPGEVPLASLYGWYLWPYSILLMGMHDESMTLKTTLWLGLSIVVNSALYLTIGVLLSVLWRRWRET